MNEPLCISAIIVATCVGSYLGFRNPAWEERYIFHPESILARKQYYRLVTSAFLHAGWSHLLLNLISLYAFGSLLESWLGKGHFLLIYFGSVVGGNLLSLYVHRHQEYRAYGASGGVCGVLFACVLLRPTGGVNPLLIPLSIPGWLYALGFVLASFYGMRANRDNIGHDAHLGGAMVGLLITAGLEPWAVRMHWPIFLAVLGVAAGLLGYLWGHPLWLPQGPVFGKPAPRDPLPRYKREALEVDEILEKVGRSGLGSLTNQERTLLEETSCKYRRREESKKPESDLII